MAEVYLLYPAHKVANCQQSAVATRYPPVKSRDFRASTWNQNERCTRVELEQFIASENEMGQGKIDRETLTRRSTIYTFSSLFLVTSIIYIRHRKGLAASDSPTSFDSLISLPSASLYSSSQSRSIDFLPSILFRCTSLHFVRHLSLASRLPQASIRNLSKQRTT